MYQIQRTKTAAGADGKPAGKPAVHWAAAVAPRGNVTAWTDDPAKAARVPDELAIAADAYYKARAEQGCPVGAVVVKDVAEEV